MRKRIIISIIIIVLSFVIAITLYIWKDRIHEFRENYSKVDIGWTENQLNNLFQSAPSIFSGQVVRKMMPNDISLELHDSDSIKLNRYTCNTFFLPVSCDFLLENGKVIRKQILE